MIDTSALSLKDGEKGAVTNTERARDKSFANICSGNNLDDLYRSMEKEKEFKYLGKWLDEIYINIYLAMIMELQTG